MSCDTIIEELEIDYQLFIKIREMDDENNDEFFKRITKLTLTYKCSTLNL